MKKAIVRNNSDEIICIAHADDLSDYVKKCVDLNCWGLPERWQQEYVRGESAVTVRPYNLNDVIDAEDRPKDGVDFKSGIQRWVKLRSDYNIEVLDITAEYELKQCFDARMKEYPTAEDFMNAFFDGGLDDLKEKRLAIKKKYPKPNASK